jgi:hypothetical protein
MCSCNSNSGSSFCNGVSNTLYSIRSLGVRCYNNTMDQKYMDFIIEIDSILLNAGSNQCPDEEYINTLKNYIESEYKKLN